MNETNLRKHMDRVHSKVQDRVNSSKVLSDTKIRSLLANTVVESSTSGTLAMSMSNSCTSTDGVTNKSGDNSDNSCRICKKTLMNETNLKKHMERVHSSVDGTSSNGTIANNGTNNSNETVETSEESDISCHICSKKLKNRTNLEKHLSRVHSKEVASVCGNQPNEDCDKEVETERRTTRSSQPAVRRRSISLLRHKGKRKY
jgi:hypothetical protein